MDASDSNDGQVFRLFDLPPELRNRIYTSIFEGDAPPRLSLLATKHCCPSAAITTTSRLLRKESLGLFQEALRLFWTGHSFYVPIESDILDDSKLEEFLLLCDKMPAPELRRLEFTRDGYLQVERKLYMVVVPDDSGGARWTVWWNPVETGHRRTNLSEATALPHTMGPIICRDCSISCVSSTQNAVLLISNCVKVTHQWAETVTRTWKQRREDERREEE